MLAAEGKMGNNTGPGTTQESQRNRLSAALGTVMREDAEHTPSYQSSKQRHSNKRL
jgi:hypothetical protein